MLAITSTWAQEAIQDEAGAISYTVAFRGVEDAQTLNRIREFSQTLELQHRPPPTLALLQRRIDADIRRIGEIMHSFGYYAAQTTSTIRQEARPIVIDFEINQGPLYRLESVNVIYPAGARVELTPPSPREMGLNRGDPARTEGILEAQRRIFRRLHERGHPFAQILHRDVVVNHDERAVEVTYQIDPGPAAVFGETTVVGLETVSESFVRNRIRWKQGQRFDARLIDRTQLYLIRTNLFSVVQAQPSSETVDGDQIPITITLSERKQQTVSAGAFYRTDDGPGGKVGWQHRNLFGGGEALSTDLTGSFIEYTGSVRYRLPDFLDVDQNLILETRIALEDPDAFRSRNQTTAATLERLINDEMTVRGGLAYRFARVTHLRESRTFGLISLPVEFEWDYSNDLLNPTGGGRFLAQGEPFYDTLGTGATFWKNYLRYSHYFEVLEQPNVVLAGRLGTGSMIGAPLFSTPADERFYGGGGGSMRGYPYKTVSPLIDKTPTGGRSIIEMSLEARWNLTETIGLVGFIDGGNAFESHVPDFSDDLLWSVGAGFRYFTPIGPLRLDVGFPLDRRRGVDDSFQIYVSIGQAF